MPQKTTGAEGRFGRTSYARIRQIGFVAARRGNARIASDQSLRAARWHRRVQRRQRFAQPSRGQQPVVEVALGHQHDIEIARQRTVLKAVVENVQLRLEFPLGELDPPHKRLSPTITGTPSRRAISSGSSPKSAALPSGSTTRTPRVLRPISAREHVEANAARFQQFSERNDEWSFARTAHRQISDADHGLRQPPRRQHAAIVERVAQRGGGAVKSGERIHAEPSRLPIIDFSRRIVQRRDGSARWRHAAIRAPPARSARAWRVRRAFSISSMKTSGNSANPTMRTALRLAKKLTTSRKFS